MYARTCLFLCFLVCSYLWCVPNAYVCSCHTKNTNTSTHTHACACAQKDIWSKFSVMEVEQGASFSVWKYLCVVTCAGVTFTRIYMLTSTQLHIQTHSHTHFHAKILMVQKTSWSNFGGGQGYAYTWIRSNIL